MAEAGTSKRGNRKVRSGLVVTESGNKTVTVLVERRKKHPLYGKVVKVSTKFHAHDENNEAKVGDRVQIVECRPMSRLKRWRVAGIQGKPEGKD